MYLWGKMVDEPALWHMRP